MLGNLLRKGSFVFLSKFALFLYGFFYVVILGRYLPMEEYGFLSIFMATALFTQFLNDGFTDVSISKFAAEYEGIDLKRLVFNALCLKIFFSFISSLIVYYSAGIIADLMKMPPLEPLLRLMPLYIFSTLPKSFYLPLMIARGRTRAVMLLDIVNICILSALLITLALHGLLVTSELVILIQVAGALFYALLGLYFVKPYLNFLQMPSGKWLRKVFHFGKYTFGTQLGTVIYSRTDTFMLGHFMGARAVAVYTIARQVTQALEVMFRAFSLIFLPEASRVFREKGREGLRELYEKGLCFLLMVTIPASIILILFAGVIFSTLYGSRYAESVGIFQIFILTLMIKPFGKVGGGVLVGGLGLPSINLKILMATALGNIALNLLLIPPYGVMGAVFATFFSVLSGVTLMTLVIRRHLDTSFRTMIYYGRGFLYFISKYGRGGDKSQKEGRDGR